MQSLFTTQPTAQVEILNFQTFTTEYVAKRYGTSEANIKEHKREHSDEILENIHFIIESNRLNRPLIKWTLRGIIKLGMFIRSPQAKNFRLWAEQELEKSINAELENARLTRERNLALVNKISALEATAIQDKKHYTNQINGYKSQIAQHNAQIAKLKSELTISRPEIVYSAEVLQKQEASIERLKALLHNAKCERDYYFKKCNELKAKQRFKDDEITRLLNKIRIQMDGVYSEIGAVMAYCYDNDRFFIQNKG